MLVYLIVLLLGLLSEATNEVAPTLLI